MSQAEKRLDAMRANPAGDWRIDDVESVCRAYGVRCRPASGGGSHYNLSHPSKAEILTIPARRPIKQVYIRELVALLDGARRSDGG